MNVFLYLCSEVARHMSLVDYALKIEDSSFYRGAPEMSEWHALAAEGYQKRCDMFSLLLLLPLPECPTCGRDGWLKQCEWQLTSEGYSWVNVIRTCPTCNGTRTAPRPANSAPARIPSARLVITTPVENGTGANSLPSNFNENHDVVVFSIHNPKTWLETPVLFGLRSALAESLILLDEYQTNTNHCWLDMIQEGES